MKTSLRLSVVLGSLLLAVGGAPARAADSPSQDVDALVNYADQLHNQGVKGQDLADKVDKRADEIAQKSGQTSLHGIGAFVLAQHARGLHGTSLAAAIHTELIRREVGKGNGKPGGPSADSGANNPGTTTGPDKADGHGESGSHRKPGK